MLVNKKVLLFDLDDTLYDRRTGLWVAIRDRMNKFLQEYLQLPPEDAVRLRQEYFQTYGTTLKGLLVEHDIDVNAYLSYVHDVPLYKYLKPDPQIAAMLASIHHKKFIFTNADAAHAKRVLNCLGFANLFQGIIDIRAMDFHCKPEPHVYQLAMRLAGVPEPGNCVLIDDSPRNILAAHDCGFFTVLVNSGSFLSAANKQIPSIAQLPAVLDFL